jgi:hypothetical protein
VFTQAITFCPPRQIFALKTFYSCPRLQNWHGDLRQRSLLNYPNLGGSLLISTIGAWVDGLPPADASLATILTDFQLFLNSGWCEVEGKIVFVTVNHIFLKHN